MNISLIGIAGVPANYGGFETVAENLIKHKIDSLLQYTVFCSKRFYSDKQPEFLGAKLKYINLNPNGISSFFYDVISMLRSLHSDAMIILGVSGSIFLPFVRLLYRGKIITNIDGIEWKRGKWNKLARFFLKISEKLAVKYSDVVIVDNQGILDYVREEYKRDAVLIGYGSESPLYIQDIETFSDEYSFHNGRYAISVCRIEPENNIHLILKAFSQQTAIPLVFVGNWKKNIYGVELFEKYSKFPHIHLLDPIYDSGRINSLRSHSCMYIHGHSAGGTNPSLVEAMFLGIPVFAFDCVYNRYTTENQCIYWSTSDELYKCISDNNTIDLPEIAERMKQIAGRRYRWQLIVSQYEELYRT